MQVADERSATTPIAARVFRAARRIVVLALIGFSAGLIVASGTGPAAAENQRPRTIFDLLFRPRDSQPPVLKQPRVRPKSDAKAKPARRKTDATAADAANAPAIVEKAIDARAVLVVGDFIGGGLADGLVEALEANPGIRVVSRANGSSGFVRDDYFDWPGQIEAIVAEVKPAAIVVMIGANDRQQMRIGETREQPLTEAWKTEYSRRVDLFATAARRTGLPLVWVGQPSFKAASMATGMIALNDIFRAAAERSGATYVDIWDGFVDEGGAFATTGPDINGQPARLRANDGINLTKAGRRKVAFYVEKPLNKLFGQGTAAPNVAVAVPQPGAALAATPAPVIDRTAPVGLDDPALDGGSELLGAAPVPAALPAAAAGRTDSPGRADDFRRVARQSPTAAPFAN